MAGTLQPEVLPLSTQDIMQRISASRETVSRVLRKMDRQGLLRVTPSSVTLLDITALQRLGLDDTDSD